MRSLTLVLAFAATADAAPTSLTSTVARVPAEPPVVIVPAAAGKTTLERYRSTQKPTSDAPLVLIARLPEANLPDVFAVTRATRDGDKIAISIESRRFKGPLYRNDVTTPLVEIALGALPTGTYTIDIDEEVMEFTKQDAPATAGKPHRGLQSSITLTIQ